MAEQLSQTVGRDPTYIERMYGEELVSAVWDLVKMPLYFIESVFATREKSRTKAELELTEYGIPISLREFIDVMAQYKDVKKGYNMLKRSFKQEDWEALHQWYTLLATSRGS